MAALAVIPASASSADRKPLDDRGQIEALVDAIVTGFSGRDLDKIMSAYAPGNELVVFDASPPLEYVGWDAVKRLNEKWLAEFTGKIEGSYSEFHVTISHDLAYGHNIQTWNFTRPDGSMFSFIERVTDGYRKINGHWLVVHEHASLPVDLGTGKAVVDAK
jgi:ketosteroid isomerase-like protein